MTMGSSAPTFSLWTVTRRSVYLWVGALFLVLGLVFSAIGVRISFEEYAYRTRGREVRAVVLDKTVIRADREVNSHTRYVVTYSFASAGGETVTETADVPIEQWEGLEPGRTFPVTYLPDKPDSGRVQDGGEWIGALVFSLIGALFTLLGAGLAFVDARYLIRAARILHHGLVTDGTVLRATPTGTSINRVPQWSVRYRYRDQFGRAHEGASHLLSPEEGLAWKEGDRGTVRFDRERPEISLWLGRP